MLLETPHMFDFIVKRSNASALIMLFLAVVASSVYLFNPGAPWSLLLASLPIPAPETQPAFGIEPIHKFFLLLDDNERGVYLYYEGFVDALFFLSIVGFSLCLGGLTLKRSEWVRHRYRWFLIIPIILLCFELFEGGTLLSTMSVSPTRIDELLWAADLATAGKIAAYAAVILIDLVALLLLSAGVIRRMR